MKGSLNFPSVQGVLFFLHSFFFFLDCFSWEFKVLWCLVKDMHLNAFRADGRKKDYSFFQSISRAVYGDSLSLLLLSIQHKYQGCCKPDEIQVHVSLSAGICITTQSLGFCRQRTFLPFFETFPTFLRTECSLCQRKVVGMTFIRMIERQSLFSLVQWAHQHWWSNKHFFISFILHFWPTHPPQSSSSTPSEHHLLNVKMLSATWQVGFQISLAGEGNGPIPFTAQVDDALTSGAPSEFSICQWAPPLKSAGILVKFSSPQHGRAAKPSVLIRQSNLLK